MGGVARMTVTDIKAGLEFNIDDTYHPHESLAPTERLHTLDPQGQYDLHMSGEELREVFEALGIEV